MGTWGVGPFDDDTAMDFVDGLMDCSETEARTRMEAAVREVAEKDGYLEYVDAVQAVAAATLLAGIAPAHDATVWLASITLELPPDLADDAVRAIARAHSEESHLHELWSESGKYDEVWAALAPVVGALRQAARPDQDTLF